MKKELQRIALSLLAVCLLTGMAAAAGPATFMDVPAEYWAYESVERLYQAGVVDGYGDGTFSPNGTLTAAHFAKMLGQTAYPEAVTAASAEDTPWYGPYTDACEALSISGGTGFSSWNDRIARYDMAVMLVNCIENVYGYASITANTARITDYDQIPAAYQYAVAQAYCRGLLTGFSDGSFGGESFMTRAQASVVICRMLDYDGSELNEVEETGTVTRGSVSTSQIEKFQYLLYTPTDPEGPMPLLVYLHGGSGKGSDLALLTADGFPKYLQEGKLGALPAYVVMPQLPATERGWGDVSDALDTLLDELCDRYPIDRENISLTGHSMGGTGVWSLALAQPGRFACIAPLSGSVRATTDNALTLADLPVWAFVGSEDTIVPPESSTQMVAMLSARGSDATLTVFDGADHFTVPELAYLDLENGLIDWLLTGNR